MPSGRFFVPVEPEHRASMDGRAAEHQAIVFFEALDAAKRFYLEYIDIGAGLLGPLLDGPVKS